MIIRFIDKKGRCCQVCTPATPVLVYMSEEEKRLLIDSDAGQCLMLVDARFSEEEHKRIVELLNTKNDPLEMKG